MKIELNPDYAYDLSELNDEQLECVAEFFDKNIHHYQSDGNTKKWIKGHMYKSLFLKDKDSDGDILWLFNHKSKVTKPVINAKTLFETKTESESEKPIQYQIGIDTFQRAEANMTKEEILACARFNIDKYNWRKKGQTKEDFEKIIAYANWALKNL